MARAQRAIDLATGTRLGTGTGLAPVVAIAVYEFALHSGVDGDEAATRWS